MKRNQTGFTIIEGLLILIIIGLVSFVGWYVWDSSKDTVKLAASDKTPSAKITGKAVEFTTVKTDNEQHEKQGYIVNGNRLIIYLGSRGSGGYSYLVNKIIKSSNQLDIFAVETKPGSTCMVTQAFTYPQTTIELNQPITEEIVLHKSTKTHNC